MSAMLGKNSVSKDYQRRTYLSTTMSGSASSRHGMCQNNTLSGSFDRCPG